jgi:hypothetical protein
MLPITEASPAQHKRWLRRQLAYAAIDHDRLLAQVILLERVICHEQCLLLRREVPPPFYNLRSGDGKESRAWLYAAEGALWLTHRHYPAYEWFTALCSWTPIRRQLLFGQQVPLNWFMPTARLNTTRLYEQENHYLLWRKYHG